MIWLVFCFCWSGVISFNSKRSLLMVLLLHLSLEWRSATRPLISNHIFFLRLNSARTSAFLIMCSKKMKKPCDEKKQKKQKNEKQHLFRFYFLCWISYFFCYWKIRQSRPTIVLKQMDFAAFKRHLKMFDWRQMGGWVSSSYYVTNKGICDVK